MLCSPDPPNYSEGDVGSEVINEITVVAEESEDASSADSGDEVPSQINYYQLLPQDISAGVDNENGTSVADYSFESSESHTIVNGAEESTTQPSNKERIDIEVNDEEVRAAMQNIILPQSAIPPWAVSVPESQWTAFLLSRITHLRTNDKS